MTQDPRLDDDTSAGAVTQGGDGRKKGHSIWWVVPAMIVVAVLVILALSMHKSAPDERNTVPVGAASTG